MSSGRRSDFLSAFLPLASGAAGASGLAGSRGAAVDALGAAGALVAGLGRARFVAALDGESGLDTALSSGAEPSALIPASAAAAGGGPGVGGGAAVTAGAGV